MEKSPISPEDFIKFFEKTAKIKFIDSNSGKPVLEIIEENKIKEKKSDYELWLEQQDKGIQQEHEMGAL